MRKHIGVPHVNLTLEIRPEEILFLGKRCAYIISTGREARGFRYVYLNTHDKPQTASQRNVTQICKQ